MHSFAVIAGFAAAANAYAYGYPEAYNTTSSVAAYETPAKSAEYGAYPAESSSAPAAYAASSAAYAASSAAYGAYPVSSKAAEYPVHTTTEVVTGLTTVCPEPTTITYGAKTYTITSSTTLVDEHVEHTTTYEVKPVPSAAKPTSVAPPANTHYAPPAYSQAPPPQVPAVPYPSASNGTVPHATGAKPSASATKPATPEFTGAAAQAGVGLLAVIGAVAAFL